jgi:hypothetical protein
MASGKAAVLLWQKLACHLHDTSAGDDDGSLALRADTAILNILTHSSFIHILFLAASSKVSYISAYNFWYLQGWRRPQSLRAPHRP